MAKCSHHLLSGSQALEITSKDQLYNYNGWSVESSRVPAITLTPMMDGKDNQIKLKLMKYLSFLMIINQKAAASR